MLEIRTVQQTSVRHADSGGKASLHRGEIVVYDEDGYIWDIFPNVEMMRLAVETERDKAAVALRQAMQAAEDAQDYMDTMNALYEDAKVYKRQL